MIQILVTTAFASVLSIPLFLFYSVLYVLVISLLHITMKMFFGFGDIKKAVYLVPVYILIFIIVFAFKLYPATSNRIEGVITNNEGVVGGMEISRVILDKKDVAVSDRDGKIMFSEKRSLLRPLLYTSPENFRVRYKNMDLSFGLNMPYFEPKIIETDYASDGSAHKFKINLDSLYLFSVQVPQNKENSLGTTTNSYYRVRDSLKLQGWLPVVPGSYTFNSKTTTTPIDAEFPEISYCGSGKGVVCRAEFKKDSDVKRVNIQHSESNEGWFVVESGS